MPRWLSGYDPNRKLDQDVMNAVIVGAAVGGIAGGGGVAAKGGLAEAFPVRAPDGRTSDGGAADLSRVDRDNAAIQKQLEAIDSAKAAGQGDGGAGGPLDLDALLGRADAEQQELEAREQARRAGLAPVADGVDFSQESGRGDGQASYNEQRLESNPTTDRPDPFTGERSFITGSRVSAEQAEGIARRVRATFAGIAKPNAAGALGVAQAQLRDGQKVLPLARNPEGVLLNTQTGQSLPEIGRGVEAYVYEDAAQGVVYKVYQIGRSSDQSIGMKLAIDEGVAGLDTGQFPDVVEKTWVINELGGTPTEIVGLTENGEIVVKQSRGNDAARYARAQVIAKAHLQEIPAEVLPRMDMRSALYYARIDGRDVLLGDLHARNFIGDTIGAGRINDLATHVLTEEELRTVPKLAEWIEAHRAQAEARGAASFALGQDRSASQERSSTDSLRSEGERSRAMEAASSREERVGAVEELVAFLRGRAVSRPFEFSEKRKTLADAIAAGETTVQAARDALAEAVGRGQLDLAATLEDTYILGESRDVVSDPRLAVYEFVNRLGEGADPTSVLEEASETYLKLALERGVVTLEDVAAWRSSVDAALAKEGSPSESKSYSKRELVEWFSDQAQAYFLGKSDGASIPAKVRAWLDKVREYLARVFDLSAQLMRLEAEGKLDKGFERALREAVGLDAELAGTLASDAHAAAIARGEASGIGPYRGKFLSRTRPNDVSVTQGGKALGGTYQLVWHGSPHRGIEKTGFKTRAIGKGEGAQAYGWGIYFAENKDVAESYRQKLSHSTPELYYKEERSNPGQLYRVEIPEADELLDWDRAFKYQPERVQAALRQIAAELPETYSKFDRRFHGHKNYLAYRMALDRSGAELYEGIAESLAQAHELGGKARTIQQQASELLQKHGVPGLRYLDGVSRRAGEGTYNFVIWDESRLGPQVAKIGTTYQLRVRRDLSVPQRGLDKAAAQRALLRLRGKPLLNEATGVQAYINTKQAGKLVSQDAVRKSLDNGFTNEQHYGLVAHIKRLWRHALPISQHTDQRGGDELTQIKRFAVPVQVGEQVRYATILAKESFEHGHRIYTLEALKEETLRGILERLGAGGSTSKHVPARSVEETFRELQAILKPKDQEATYQLRSAPEDEPHDGSKGSPKGYLRLFHAGREGVTEILDVDTKVNGYDGGRFGGLFALSDLGNHDGIVDYYMDVPEDKIANSFNLKYESDWEVIEPVLRREYERAGMEGYYDFETWTDWVLGEDQPDRVTYDKYGEIVEEVSPDTYGDFDWDAQRARGQVAKAMGYQAVEMTDEHGTSYLVLPGVPVRRVQDDTATYQLRSAPEQLRDDAGVLLGTRPAVDGTALATTPEVDFRARVERVAPQLMLQYRGLVGDPQLLLEMGASPKDLETSPEQAAGLARQRERILWFLQRNLRADKRGRMPEALRGQIVDAATQAWLLAQPPDRKAALRDHGRSTGLLGEQYARRGDWVRYWAERLGEENAKWARGEPPSEAGGRGFMPQVAAEFRGFLAEAIELLGRIFTRTKRYNIDFERFLAGEDGDAGALVNSAARRSLNEAASSEGAAEPVPVAVRQGGKALGATYQLGWHGSPYRGIEKEGFKRVAIGTGEGVQAHGWGLYFAENRKVAEMYREQGAAAQARVFYKGQELDVARWEQWRTEGSAVERRVAGLLDYGPDVAERAGALLEGYEQAYASGPKPEYLEVISVLREFLGELRTEPAQGQLYQVDLPENEELLDLDKPFAEQPKRVQAALRKIWSVPQIRRSQGMLREDVDGRWFYERLAEALGDEGDPRRGGAERASEILQKHGVPGARYQAGGANFVIWDDARLGPDVAKIQTTYQLRSVPEGGSGQSPQRSGEEGGRVGSASPVLGAYRSQGLAAGDALSNAGADQARNGTVRHRGDLTVLQKRRAREVLLNMSPVPVLGLSPTLAGKALRKAAQVEYQRAAKKGLVTLSDGRLVELTGVGFKKVRSHSADRRLLDLLPDIREVLEAAVPVASLPHEAADHTDSIRAWHYYGAKIALRGEELYAKLVVRESVNGQIYYDTNFSTVEGVVERGGDAIPDKPEAARLSDDAPTLAQLLDEVNPATIRAEGIPATLNPHVQDDSGSALTVVTRPEGVKEASDITYQLRQLTTEERRLRALNELGELNYRIGQLEGREDLSGKERSQLRQLLGERSDRHVLLGEAYPNWRSEHPKLARGEVVDVRATRRRVLERDLKNAQRAVDRGEIGAERQVAQLQQILKREFGADAARGAGGEGVASGSSMSGASTLSSLRPPDGSTSEADVPTTAARPEDESRTPALIEGHSHVPEWKGKKEVNWLLSWLRGFRGTVPELPAMSDDNAQRWAALKRFKKEIARATPRVWHEAGQRIAAIAQPLLEGVPIDAEKYRLLQQIQKQIRRLEERSQKSGGAEHSAKLAELRGRVAQLDSELESHPYVLFGKLVRYLDMDWRVRNLKDSAGNPIAMPGGLTPEQVAAELERLKGLVRVHAHSEKIVTALEAHLRLVKRVWDELKARDLTVGAQAANPYYYPHLVMGKEGAKSLERVRLDTADVFRGYLVEPVGSVRPIETDYVKAMHAHVVAVDSHNTRADLVRDLVKEPYDIMPQLQKKAKALSKQWGRPVSWSQVFNMDYAKQGWVRYVPDNRLHLHSEATVNRQKLAERLGVALGDGPLQEELRKLGIAGVELLPGDIREAMVANEKEVWIVPEEVAAALDGMIKRESKYDEMNPALRVLEGSQNLWKRNILFAPWNYIRYEYNNTVSDIEKLFSVDPGLFLKLPEALREVLPLFGGEGEASALAKIAMRLGVMQSVTVSELGKLPQLEQFAALKTSPERAADIAKAASTLFLTGGRSTVELSQLREATFRYAKFKADVERMCNGARPVYGGAYWKDVEAIRVTQSDLAAIQGGTLADTASGPVLSEREARLLEFREFLDGPPIAENDGTQFQKADTPLEDRVAQWYADNHYSEITVPDVGTVLLDKAAVKNSISHGFGRNKAAAFALVPDVLLGGKIIHTAPMEGSRDGLVHYVAAPVRMGGRDFIATVLLKSDQNVNRMYVHEVFVREKLQQSAFKTGADAATGTGEPSRAGAGAITTVLREIYSVKGSQTPSSGRGVDATSSGGAPAGGGVDPSIYLKAAEISLANFGDYNNISVSGQGLRKLMVPFYSWIEINFRYHANLFRNLKDMVQASEMSKAEAREAGTRAATVLAASFSRRVAARVLTRLLLPYVAVALWNNSDDRREMEEKLSEADRRRFHIILGRDKNGRVMVIYGATALGDIMRWFGGDDLMRLSADLATGRTTLGTAIEDYTSKFLPDLANNLFGGVGPVGKGMLTGLSRRDFFPDVGKPRTIPAYELRWNILSQMTDGFTADMIRRVADKDYLAPRDMGDWVMQLSAKRRRRTARSAISKRISPKRKSWPLKLFVRRVPPPVETRLRLLAVPFITSEAAAGARRTENSNQAPSIPMYRVR